MFKIMGLGDPAIEKIVEQCDPNDVYCQLRYLKIFSRYLSTEGFYAFYGDENNYILTPFFKKALLDGQGDKYYDLISPWYYGGPIYRADSRIVAEKIFKSWKEEFNDYCRRNNIVSEFQRLNPIRDNHLFYLDDTNLFFNREVVCVDLKKDLEQICKEYAYKARKNIRRGEEAGLRLIRSKTKADWEKFIEVYLASMKIKKTDPFYYFNGDFFDNFFTNFYDELEIFRVEYQGKTIAATVVLGKYGILHDYLRGSRPQYLSFRANDFMVHNIIGWAKDNGYSHYSLGGGHSTNQNDSLLNFKKSFSPDRKNFYIYKRVHNLEKYRQLCSVAGLKEDQLTYEQASFFPEYFKL